MTSRNGTIERTGDGGVIRFDRHLDHPVEDVWSALTTPERMVDWWPPVEGGIEVDLREGGAISFRMPGEEEPMRFVIERLDPPRVLQYAQGPGASMRYELEPADGGTRLRATYTVAALDEAMQRGDAYGAHYGLDRLEAALHGRPEPVDMAAFERIRDGYTGQANSSHSVS